MMKRSVVAALAVALMLPAGMARAVDGRCYSPSAIEADQALRFIVNLMVASTACRDQTYGLFQQRNHQAILAYQRAMIAHFHGNAAYDRWDTALANEASMRENAVATAQFCQKAAPMMKTASALDNKGFRAYAASLAATAAPQYRKCRRR